MTVELPIKQMTLLEKLEAMELLWSDLLHDENQVPVPSWHKDLLDERERLVRESQAHFSNWDTAKQRIAGKVRVLSI